MVPCAVRASIALRSERDAADAARARHTATRPLLPSNPVVSLSAGRPLVSQSGRSSSLTWYASISQELEIAGQRGARREAAGEEVRAQDARVTLTARDVAAAAWVGYFDALAAKDEVELTRAVEAAASRVFEVTGARAEQKLTASVEADLANAESLRALQTRASAERRLQSRVAMLTTLLGGDPASSSVSVEGDLQPLPRVELIARQSLGIDAQSRPEVQVLLAERRAAAARAEAFRRSRIPNPTVSIFAQRDEISDRVLGLGLAFPIPLPEPVGRLYVGEIAENEASARRSGNEAERTRRQLRLDTVVSLREFESRRDELAAFDAGRLARAKQTLTDVSEEVRAGRLTVRDAIVTQQTLIQLLQAHIEARRALCVASVDLARAAGVTLEGGHP
ncbi:MAG: TolC family protein [Deltaproteobacteria bacterium]|nr:TolC family protein [Deltaproteobacteria bacterium]